MKILAEN